MIAPHTSSQDGESQDWLGEVPKAHKAPRAIAPKAPRAIAPKAK